MGQKPIINASHFLVKRMMALVFPGAIITTLLILITYLCMISLQVSLDQKLDGLPRTTYDLLIRPPDSVNAIEMKYGLVRPNHLNGISGGISLEQYETIKALPNIEVAAPIAVLGYLNRGNTSLYVQDPLPDGVYQLSASDMVNDGTTTIPSVIKNPFYVLKSNKSYSLLSENQEVNNLVFKKGIALSDNSFYPGSISLHLPSINDLALLVAVDPAQEAELVGLDQTLTKGNYLPHETQLQPDKRGVISLPVLFNLHDSIDQAITIDLQKLDYELDPKATFLEQLEAVPDLETLSQLSKQTRMTVNLDILREWLAPAVRAGIKNNQVVDLKPISYEFLSPLYKPMPVEYRELSSSVINSDTTGNIFEAIPQGITSSPEPKSIIDDLYPEEILDWLKHFEWSLSPEIKFRNLIPQSNQILFFEIDAINSGSYEMTPPVQTAEASLNPVPLETYYPPTAVLKYDEEGNPLATPLVLSPTLNAEGYMVAPPDLLISLSSVKLLFENSCRQINNGKIEKVPCVMDENFISAIRVRMSGITPMDAAAQEKIEALAQEIVEKTGLHVDVMVGSSPQPVLIHLPGYENLPAKGYIEEQWIKKGVVTSIQNGFSGFQSILFFLLFFYAFLFLALLNHNVMLSRTSEVGLLTSFGWRRRDIFSHLALEPLLATGMILLFTSAASMGILKLASFTVDYLKLGLDALIMLAVLCFSMFYPVWRISSKPPIQNILRGEISAASTTRHITRLRGYMLNDIQRKPLRALATWINITLSTFVLGFLLIANQNITQSLDITLLGRAVKLDLQPQMLVMGAALLVISVMASCLLFFANLSERQSEIATLHALGWQKGTLQKTLLAPPILTSLAGLISGLSLALLMSLAIFKGISLTGAFWVELLVYCFAAPLVLFFMGAYTILEVKMLGKLWKKESENDLHAARQNRIKLLLSIIIPVALLAAGYWIDFPQGKHVYPVIPDASTPIPAANASPVVVPTPVALSTLTRYQLDLNVDEQNEVITGSEVISYTNQTGAPLETIVLRLYPNAPQFGEVKNRAVLSSVSVVDIPVIPQFSQDNSVVTLILPEKLQPEKETKITLDFSLSRYGNQENRKDYWYESSFFPMLAVYDQSGWRKDVCTFCGDIVYSESAFFDYSINLPSKWQVATSGKEISNQPVGKDRIKRTYQVGPVRDLAMSFSTRFTQAEETLGETTLYVDTFDDAEGAEEILNEAQNAASFFSKEYGDYPYKTLSVVGIKGDFNSGMEYPAYISLGYNTQEERFPLLLAHEVAHQWWYGIIGNDIFNEPWLDEALAQYSALKYIKNTYGDDRYYAFIAQMKEDLDRGHIQDTPFISPVASFEPDGNGYHETIYYKGSLRLLEIESLIGEENFTQALREYHAQNLFGVATGKNLRSLLQQYTSINLAPFFEK